MTTTPRLRVHLFAAAAAALDADEREIEAGTVAQALEVLCADTSEEARRIVARSSILVNAVACTDHDQQLADGDRLDVLPPFAGG